MLEALEGSTLDAAIAGARTGGDQRSLPTALVARAVVLDEVGRWFEAEADAREAIEHATRLDLPRIEAQARTLLIRLCGDMGRVDTAHRHAELAAEAIGRAETPTMAAALDVARARLHVLQGELAPARRLLSRALHDGDIDHGVVARGRFELVGVLMALGRRRDAVDLCDSMARATVVDPRDAPLIAHGQGLVTEDVDDAIGRLRTAVDLFERRRMRFDQARAELDLAVVSQQAGRPDPHLLHEAARRFASVGAAPWVRRVEARLATTPHTVRTELDELSPRERQVALLAASGGTARDMADELFLSHRTVESHLRSSYRKLGIRNRIELVALLSRTTPV